VITVTLTMYDSTNVGALPHGADAYAGYVEGLFPTFAALKRQFAASGAHLLSIAVFASGDAECLDIEPGDATNAQAPGWVKRQLARGAHRPCLYTSVGNMDALVTALGGAAISRAAVRLWSAHYGQGKHICGLAIQPIVEESMLLKTGAGPLTPVAIPHGATHVRLLAQDTATIGVHFHNHGTTTLDLSWVAGSQRVAVPKGVFAALVQRVDAGTGDVSLVCE
jgi:hypothetical protein